jgi:hypothetical protein
MSPLIDCYHRQLIRRLIRAPHHYGNYYSESLLYFGVAHLPIRHQWSFRLDWGNAIGHYIDIAGVFRLFRADSNIDHRIHVDYCSQFCDHDDIQVHYECLVRSSQK